jgi:hypothetical protein
MSHRSRTVVTILLVALVMLHSTLDHQRSDDHRQLPTHQGVEIRLCEVACPGALLEHGSFPELKRIR